MDRTLSPTSVLGCGFSLRLVDTFSRCSYLREVSGSPPIIGRTCSDQTSRAPGVGSFPEAPAGTSARRDSNSIGMVASNCYNYLRPVRTCDHGGGISLQHS